MARSAKLLVALVRRVAPAVFALEAKAEQVPTAAFGRQNRLEQHRRARNDGDLGLLRQFDVVVGRDRVDQHLELEGMLAKSLDAHAGRALAPIAEAHDDLIAFSKKTTYHLDV